MSDFHIELGDGVDGVLGLTRSERFRHCYTVGLTGSGKSTFIGNLAIADMQAGRGITFLDPHGEARKLLDYVPKARTNDVVFFDPSDIERIPSLNIFRTCTSEMHSTAAAAIVATFAHIFELSPETTPRLLHYLRNAVLALSEQKDSTMLSLLLMLSDEKFRQSIVARIKNPIVRRFWTDEVPGHSDRYNDEAMAPVISRVQAFLSYDTLLRVLCQPQATIDIQSIIDDGKIFICDLNQGVLGEEPSRLLGALIVTQLQIATMARAAVPESERLDHFAYIDEFQSMVSGSYDTLFSGARKMNLGMTVSHQHKAQLSPQTFAAVRGNAGTLTAFRVAADDATDLVREFAPLSASDLTDQAPFEAWVKRPLSPQRRKLYTRPLPALTRAPRRDRVIRHSREAHTKARRKVDEDLARVLGG